METVLRACSLLLRPEEPRVYQEGEAHILEHPVERAFLRLNATAWRIWELLELPIEYAVLCDRLAAEFDVPRAECEVLARGFVWELRDRGLIEVRPPASGPLALRRRYLHLLKCAVVNLLYPEHELRINCLLHRGLTGDPYEDECLLRDIRYRLPQDYAELLAAKTKGMPLHRQVTRYSHTMVGLKRLSNLEYCAEEVFRERIPGDFLEAGVCQGGAAIFMRALQVAYEEPERRMWVADSYRGLPPPTAEPDRRCKMDLTPARQPWLAISRQAVEDNFRTYDLLDERVRFLEGWFSDTLPSAPLTQLALLRVDADLYQSTRDVLEALYGRVAVGGFVVVDDYGAFEACRLAVDSFRQERGSEERLRRIDWTGVYWRKAG